MKARLLSEGDRGAAAAFLEAHTAEAYFLASNLRQAGILYTGDRYSSDHFGAFVDGRLVGVLAHSWLDNLQLWVENTQSIPALVCALKAYREEHPRVVRGVLGLADQVQSLMEALGIGEDAIRPGRGNEFLFSLRLEALRLPSLLAQKEVHVRPAQSQDAALLSHWRHDFFVEALGDPAGQETMGKAQADIERMIGAAGCFVAEAQGRVQSMASVQGYMPKQQMVGAVWTPPEARGHGFAKAVTAGALQMRRDQGVEEAVLFARRPDAIRAYESLGFTRRGAWKLEFLKEPYSVR